VRGDFFRAGEKAEAVSASDGTGQLGELEKSGKSGGAGLEWQDSLTIFRDDRQKLILWAGKVMSALAIVS
jgi:hypothetical protein